MHRQTPGSTKLSDNREDRHTNNNKKCNWCIQGCTIVPDRKVLPLAEKVSYYLLNSKLLLIPQDEWEDIC